MSRPYKGSFNFRANIPPKRDILHMVVPASLLVLVTSYYPHHAKLQTSLSHKSLLGGVLAVRRAVVVSMVRTIYCSHLQERTSRVYYSKHQSRPQWHVSEATLLLTKEIELHGCTHKFPNYSNFLSLAWLVLSLKLEQCLTSKWRWFCLCYVPLFEETSCS